VLYSFKIFEANFAILGFEKKEWIRWRFVEFIKHATWVDHLSSW